MSRMCVVIPLYKQLEAIAQTLAIVESYQLPCILVDDGNEANVREYLRDLVAGHPQTTLHSLGQNQGKGGAVMAGLQLAQERGFTHALQVDADGQHDLTQIPVFVSLSGSNPQALVSGQPVYDESANRMRLAARQLTHFWVKVQTLSLTAPDTMCGFRVYPLKETCALLERVSLGRRMDFDIEVMVRLLWEGVPVVKLPTKVIYPEGGQSNFDYLSDNILITKMHIKLVCGMLLRLPSILLGRKGRRAEAKEHWSEIEEVGVAWGMRLMVWTYKLFGRGLFKAILWPVIAYYYQTNHRARRASREYLARVYQTGSSHPKLLRPPDWRTGFQHFLQFGRSNLDRIASWMGQMNLTELHFVQKEEFLKLHHQKKGALIISSHLGNIEMCRGLVQQFPGVKWHILMHTEHAGKFNSIIRELNASADLGIIQVNQIGPETAVFLKESIERGEFVVILGDRTPVRARDRVSEVQFLGDKTNFPQGPYVLAHLLDCPVYVMFCLEEEGRYCLYMEKFAERIKLSRKTREADLQALAQRYAQALESYCLKQPLQWFNFYDFWGNKTLDQGLNSRDESTAG